MKCSKCDRKAETNLRHLGALCMACFCATVEKRIRRYVRINKVFSKNDRIVAVGELNHYLIPKIIEGLPVTIRKVSRIPGQPKGKIIVIRSADDVACEFAEKVFAKTANPKKNISIVSTATDEELSLFCRFRRIPFRPNIKNKDIQKIIDALEDKHPETKFSIVKSAAKLQQIQRR
jgi:hypothetical protein